MTSLVTLAAPGPYQIFEASSGKTYLSDGNSQIANVPPQDASDLVKLGCVSPFSPNVIGIIKGNGTVYMAATAGTDYVAPGGIAGGQTVVGGTANGQGLTLQSTSAPTRGTITASDPVTIQGNTSNATLTLKAPASATKHALDVADSNGNISAFIDFSGRYVGFGTSNSNAAFIPPNILTITPQGTTGSTSYAYEVSCVDATGHETVTSGQSASHTISNGNATLGAGNTNLVSWNAINGAVKYKVYGRSGSLASLQLLATVIPPTTTFIDDGSITPSGAVPGAPTGATQTYNTWEVQSGDLMVFNVVNYENFTNKSAWFNNLAQLTVAPEIDAAWTCNGITSGINPYTANPSTYWGTTNANARKQGAAVAAITFDRVTALPTIAATGNVGLIAATGGSANGDVNVGLYAYCAENDSSAGGNFDARGVYGFTDSISTQWRGKARGVHGRADISSATAISPGGQVYGGYFEAIGVSASGVSTRGIFASGKSASAGSNRAILTDVGEAGHVEIGGHLLSSGTTPTIAAGAGAGTSPIVSISGTDIAGVITCTTGGSPVGSGTLLTVTFGVGYGSTPRAIVLSPCNGNAAALSGTSAIFADSANWTSTNFTLSTGSVAPTGATQYKWAYQVAG